MKSVFPFFLGIFMCLAGLNCVFTTWITHKAFRNGFDSGRADVLRSMHNCISSNDSQWVENGKMMYERLPGNVEYISREYTNRFFTNQVLRVRFHDFGNP